MLPVPIHFYSLAYVYLELQVVCEEKGRRGHLKPGKAMSLQTDPEPDFTLESPSRYLSIKNNFKLINSTISHSFLQNKLKVLWNKEKKRKLWDTAIAASGLIHLQGNSSRRCSLCHTPENSCEGSPRMAVLRDLRPLLSLPLQPHLLSPFPSPPLLPVPFAICHTRNAF